MYCTKCGSQIYDSAAFCIKCGTPVNGKQWAANEVVSSAHGSENLRRPKIPGITLTACIILYVLFGLGILSNLSIAGEMPVVFVICVGFGILNIGCVVGAQQGRNWARIVLTALCGLVLISFNDQPILGLVLGVVIFAIPLTFLWLPRSNKWYRVIKSQSK